MRQPLIRGLCLAIVAALLLGGAALSQQGKGKKPKFDTDGKNDLKGRARWQWVLDDGKGDNERGTFMAFVTGEVSHNKNKIGSWTKTGNNEMKVTFTEGPLQGIAELTLTQPRPAVFRGELVRKDGKKQRLVVTILND
jgi:hypothetical protein